MCAEVAFTFNRHGPFCKAAGEEQKEVAGEDIKARPALHPILSRTRIYAFDSGAETPCIVLCCRNSCAVLDTRLLSLPCRLSYSGWQRQRQQS